MSEAAACLAAGSAPPCDRREDRRNAILDAATALFMEQGYERVSLAAIVKRSGGSLATLYELFGNKQGLLRAMVERSIERNLLCWAGIDVAAVERPSILLRDLAVDVHAHMTQPNVIALQRIVIGESLRDPEFARAFHDQFHKLRMGELAGWFRTWTTQGKAAIDDPEAAAELYMATVMSDAKQVMFLGADCCCDTARSVAGIEWRLAPFFSYFRIP